MKRLSFKKRKLYTRSLLLIFVYLVFGFFPDISKSAVLEPIDILTGEWSPYTSENLEGYGLASEIVSSVLIHMGYRPNYIFLPFSEAYELTYESDTNEGVRGTFPYWKESFIDENGKVRYREQEMYFSNPLTKKKTKTVIYFNTKTSNLQKAKKISDLSGCKLIVVIGYAYPKEIIEKFKKKENRIMVDRESSAFEKLCDESEPYIIVAEEEVGDQILNEQYSDKQDNILKIDAESLRFEEEIYFIVSKRNPNNLIFINEFNTNLEKLQDQGVIETLEVKYERGPVVRLKNSGRSLLPVGKENINENIDDNLEYKLPRGTQAVVIKWGGDFDPDNEEFDTHTLVEIINGPLKGKKLYIENIFIELP